MNQQHNYLIFNVLTPNIIGETYKDGAYKSIMSRLKQKVGRK